MTPERLDLKPVECERLRSELAVLTRSRHVTKADIRQRIRDHTRWCPCTTGWALPRNIPRDPQQEVTP